MAQITITEIRAISDPEHLTELIDELRSDLTSIETQLEWRDIEDEAWEARAISALSFHRMALSEALRQERRITGKTAESQKTAADQRLAKALRKEVAASNRAHDLEERKLREHKRRNDMHSRALRLVELVSTDAAFRRAARTILDGKTFAAIEAAATRQVQGVIKDMTNQVEEAV